MKVKIEIDIEDAFIALSPKERISFINSHLDVASKSEILKCASLYDKKNKNR